MPEGSEKKLQMGIKCENEMHEPENCYIKLPYFSIIGKKIDLYEV